MTCHERTIWLLGLSCWLVISGASIGQESPPTEPGTPPLAKPTTLGEQATTPLAPAAAAPQAPTSRGPAAQPGLSGPPGSPLLPPGAGGGIGPMMPGTGPFPTFVDPVGGPPG